MQTVEHSSDIVEEAITLATKWQNRANALQNSREKTRHKKLGRLFANPTDKIILTKLIDQSFRSANYRRVADQIYHLLTVYGIPDFFSPVEKALMYFFNYVGRFFPALTVPAVIEKMRRDSSHLMIPGERKALEAFLQKRKNQGIRININHIGEVVLGEEDAAYRLKMYLEDLQNPLIEFISIKISTILSQIQTLAFEHTVDILKTRLSELYRTAAENEFVRKDGTRVQKFVNLDMESYSDLAITAEAFIRTLDQDEFKNYSAGMALQAYLPDSYIMLQEIISWARKRVADGGSPIKIRIVKGANMEMEQIESAVFDWPLAPFDNKQDVDSNWKRMVDFGMKPENIGAVHLGIASHNLFDIAYAYLVARENGVTDYFTFEMIEGMANHVCRAVQETGQEVVVYAPVATKAQFIHAIAYLIRRMDENTGPQNFLQHLNQSKTNTRSWEFLKSHFRTSIKQKNQAAAPPHRNQNRLAENFPNRMGTFYEADFKNEPNTDWSLKANRTWAEEIRQSWKKGPEDEPLDVPIVVAGMDIFSERKIHRTQDPSQINTGVVVARCALAHTGDVERAVATAKSDPDGWRQKALHDRHQILSGVAAELRMARADLIGAAAATTGKVFTEADVEVSEAIDFAEYYPYSLKSFEGIENIRGHPKGVGLVISPWNFPIAIPCGGIAAALAAGNTVIFKPSSDAIAVAWLLCQCFWRAGITKNVLQFLPCSGTTEGPRLTGHPDIDFIILTGGTDTGMKILKQRPNIYLAAETGGKNATIVTAMADRDQAIGNVIYSAFGNSGQKCSATSLLILEAEVYDDPGFKRQLIDAAKSFRTSSAWDFSSKMGPLIHPPKDELKDALTRLQPGESWALKPINLENNPYLWTPGIKWDVQPGSSTHLIEFFGPLLGVMRATDLDRAIELVNQTGYGLTSGLESLDSREKKFWQEHIKAGNLYVNRGTTGAVTLRQPFGGMGKSAIGAGIKAGSPTYAVQFMAHEDTQFPPVGPFQQTHPLLNLATQWQQKLDCGQFNEVQSDIRKAVRAMKSYIYHVEQHFSRYIDYFHLRGQDNILRYLPVGIMVVRLHKDDNLFETLARIAAARIAGCKLRISISDGLDNGITRFLHGKDGQRLIGNTRLNYETDKDIIERISKVDRIRYAMPQRVPVNVLKAAAAAGFYIARSPVLMEGSIELLQYYQQQSICNNYHRYGNLGARAAGYQSN